MFEAVCVLTGGEGREAEREDIPVDALGVCTCESVRTTAPIRIMPIKFNTNINKVDLLDNTYERTRIIYNLYTALRIKFH